MLHIEPDCYKTITDYFNDNEREQGGILGVSGDLWCITDFYPDASSSGSVEAFCPNTAQLNCQIDNWRARGVSFCGVIHSHVLGSRYLSVGDMKYIERQLCAFSQMPFLWFPLVVKDNEKTEIIAFRCFLHNGQALSKQEDFSICSVTAD